MGKPQAVYLSLTTQADPPAAPQAGFHKNETPCDGQNIRVKELQMRKLFYFTSILLITAGMTFAQAGGSGSGSTAGSGGAGASGTGSTSGDQGAASGSSSTGSSADQGAAAGSSSTGSQSGSSATSTGTASGDQTSISGCISKSGNDFVLTDANGTPYKLDGSGLDAHVGHQASLTGSMGTDNKFKVTDAKMISDSCSTSGASAAPAAGAAAPAASASSTDNPPSSPNSTAPVADSGLKSNNAPVPSANDNAAPQSGSQ